MNSNAAAYHNSSAALFMSSSAPPPHHRVAAANHSNLARPLTRAYVVEETVVDGEVKEVTIVERELSD